MEFKCYSQEVNDSSKENLVGHCLVFEGTNLSEAQYLFETFILGRDLGRNPFDFNVHKYNDIQESESLLLIKESLLRGDYILTDLGPDRSLKLYIGLHYIEDNGEYYVIRVPKGTTRIVSDSSNIEFKDENKKTLRSEKDSYILIMRNNQETSLEFGSGTITTRSYLIAEDPYELTKLSYIANGSKFLNGVPQYFVKTSRKNPKNNSNIKVGKMLSLPTTESIRVLSDGDESWNDYDKGWKKGDRVLYFNLCFECIVDYTNDNNFNNVSIWRRV